MHPHSRLLSLTLLAAFAGGCSSGSDSRLPLSGAVQFDGQPVVYGEVFFQPDKAAGHTGPQGFAIIRNGRYDTAEDGKGVLPGPHIVQVSAYSEVPLPPGPDDQPTPSPVPLISGFKIKADLTASRYDIDIPAPAKGGAAGTPKAAKGP